MRDDIYKNDRNSGYARAYRNTWSHEIFSDFLEAAIWNYLYQNAFWKDGYKTVNGTVFEVKRGQIVVTARFLANGFRITERVVRYVIQKLEKHEMVSVKTTNKASVITICNYDKFQCFEKTEGKQDVNQTENGCKTKGANKKEDNKINNIIHPHTPSDDFQDFWEGWKPYDMDKGSKANARRFYEKARKDTDHETIIGKRNKYLAGCHAAGRKTRHAATWLSQRGWEDDISLPSAQKADTRGSGQSRLQTAHDLALADQTYGYLREGGSGESAGMGADSGDIRGSDDTFDALDGTLPDL